jgi:hypothetical protein
MGQAYSSRRSFDPSAELPRDQKANLDKSYRFFYGANANPNLTNSFTVTQPEQPRNLLRVSELIDPHELLGLTPDDLTSYPYKRNNSKCYKQPKYPSRGVNKRLPPLVESPSGTMLGAHEFISRPNRPLAIRERQESIRRAIEKAQRQERSRIALRPPHPVRNMPLAHERNGSKGSISSQGSSYYSDNGSRKGSATSNYSDYDSRKGSDTSYYSDGSGRNGSSGSIGTIGSFESSKIEEGRRAYEAKMRHRDERANSTARGLFRNIRY